MHSSRVVPERATPMMKMGVGPANALDDSRRRRRPRRQVTFESGMVVRDFITRARMHQRIAAHQRLSRFVIAAQVLRRLVTREFEAA